MSNIMYLYEYFPGNEPQSPEQQKIRDELTAFKQGACPESVKTRIADVLRKMMDGDSSDWTVCFVPATDLETTVSRYYELSQYLSDQFPDCVYLNTLELSDEYDALLEEARQIKCRSARVKGKKVAVVDYVYNTGAMFDDVERILLDGGAVSVDGLFIAKVVRNK